MKKLDTLNKKLYQPKKKTIQSILHFSKSIEVVQVKNQKEIFYKN